MRKLDKVEFVETFYNPYSGYDKPAKVKGCGRYRFHWSNGKVSHPYAIVLTKEETRIKVLRCCSMTLYVKVNEVRPNKQVICDALERGMSRMDMVVQTPPRRGVHNRYVGTYMLDLTSIAFDMKRREVLGNDGDTQIMINLNEMVKKEVV